MGYNDRYFSKFGGKYFPKQRHGTRSYNQRSQPYRPVSAYRPNPYTWVNPKSVARQPSAHHESRQSESRHRSVERASPKWGDRSRGVVEFSPRPSVSRSPIRGTHRYRSVEKDIRPRVFRANKRSRSPSSSSCSSSASTRNYSFFRKRCRSPSVDSCKSYASHPSKRRRAAKRSRSPSSRSERPYTSFSKRYSAMVSMSPSPEFIILDEYNSEEEEVPQAVDTPELLGTLNRDDMRKQMESWETEKDEDFVIPRNKGNKAKVISFCNPVKPAVFMDKKTAKPVTEALTCAKSGDSAITTEPAKTHEPADLPELWGYYMSASMERQMAQWELEAQEDFIASSQGSGKRNGSSVVRLANKRPAHVPVMRQSQWEARPGVKAPVANRKHPMFESEALAGAPLAKIHINVNHPRFRIMFQW